MLEPFSGMRRAARVLHGDRPIMADTDRARTLRALTTRLDESRRYL